MHKNIGLLIVEDDLLIAEDLKETLEEVGYHQIFKARNYKQAIEILQTESIDFALLDINLSDSQSGVDLANYINKHYHFPFIYITSYSDANTIANVKTTVPAGFLLKPYSKELLIVKIEIAFFNYCNKKNAANDSIDVAATLNEDTDLLMNNHLLVKDNYRFVKIPLTDILWFESNKNYVDIKTTDRKYTIRCSLKKLAEQLPITDFVKCYKQFIININHVESFNTQAVIINGQEIPIGRSVQEEVVKKLKQYTSI